MTGMLTKFIKLLSYPDESLVSGSAQSPSSFVRDF